MAYSSQSDIYISQRAVGSDDGTGCANAHSASWFNTAENWGTGSGKIGAGVTAHLCGVISTSLQLQGGGAAGQPVTILFEPNARMSAPYWEDVLWGNRAAILSREHDYVVIDGGLNGIIEATDSGTTSGRGGNATYSYENTGVIVYGSNNWEVRNLRIQGMYRRVPLSDDGGGGTGILGWGGSNASIHHNQVTDANTGIAYQYYNDRTIRIFNNTISRISNGITFGSSNTGSLADDVQIYNNDISEGYVWDGIFANCTGNCWFHNDGIQAWAVHSGSQLTNLSVYGNYIHGDMGQHITGWIFLEGNIVSPPHCQ